MKSILVISFLTILRLGIPASILLLIGETVKHHHKKIRNS